MGLDDAVAGSLTKAECCYQDDESEAMVSMQLTRQDVCGFCYGDMITGEADVHTLAAIHHK